MQLYSALEREVQSDAFTEALARSQHELQQHPPVPTADAAQGGCEVLAQDWWELKEDGELRGEADAGLWAVLVQHRSSPVCDRRLVES